MEEMQFCSIDKNINKCECEWRVANAINLDKITMNTCC